MVVTTPSVSPPGVLEGVEYGGVGRAGRRGRFGRPTTAATTSTTAAAPRERRPAPAGAH